MTEPQTPLKPSPHTHLTFKAHVHKATPAVLSTGSHTPDPGAPSLGASTLIELFLLGVRLSTLLVLNLTLLLVQTGHLR